MVVLRDYQTECLDAIKEYERKGVRKQLVVLPTGCGKTVVFSHIPKILDDALPMLVLAHREELLTQAKEKIEWANPGLNVEIEQAENRASTEADIVVASVATLGRDASDRITKFGSEHFRTVVIDEAHHAAAVSYRRILDRFDSALRIGVTATPQRGDNVRLTDVFDEVVYYKTILEMMQQKYLAPLVGYRIKTDTDISSVSITGGDFADGQLGEAINTPERNALVVKSYKELCEVDNRKTLVFAATVEHAEALVQAFREAGVRCGAVFGSTPRDERQAILARFSSGSIQVLVNVGVLTEGFDEPSVSAIILARPTRSPLLYTQIVGRGTRLCEGKRDCLVVDLADVSGNKKPLGLPTLLGLPYEFDLEGQDLEEAYKKFKALEEKAPAEAARVKSLADIDLAWERIDLFMPPPPNPVVQEYSRLVWAEVGEDSYWLNLSGTERLHISGDALGSFHVTLSDSSSEGTERVQRELGVVPDLREAFARSDRWVQKYRGNLLSLLESDAQWRVDPPTDKQIKALKKFGVPVTSDLTKGMASEMLDKLFRDNPKPEKPAWLQKKINASKFKGF